MKQIEFVIKKTSVYQKLSPKSDIGDLICTSLAWSFPVTHRLPTVCRADSTLVMINYKETEIPGLS